MKAVAFIGGASVGLGAGLVAGSKFDSDIVQAVVGLLGVGVGWLLGVGWDGVKRNRERRAMRQLLRQELASNLYMLPQKRDVLQQMSDKLKEKRILPGDSVRFMTNAYTAHFPAIAEDLSLRERNSFHWIYENMRTMDATMASFADAVLTSAKEELVMQCYGGKLKDLLELSKLMEDVATKHLNGSPVDVFHTEQTFKTLQNAEFIKPEI